MKSNSCVRRYLLALPAVLALVASCLVIGASNGGKPSVHEAVRYSATGPVPMELFRFPSSDTASAAGHSHDANRKDPFDSIDRCVRTAMQQSDTPGAAIAIFDGGQFVYERGYGVKHREQGGDVNSSTLFRFGSILKMMTAAAVMQQVEKGNVDLDAPVTHYIPEFQIAPPWPSSSIKLSHLLTHSSSFPDRYDPYMWKNGPAGPTTPTALSEWAAGQSAIPLSAPPGSFWNYSNPNFSLAGLVVERASRVEYHQYMKQNVFQPAGMAATTLLPSRL